MVKPPSRNAFCGLVTKPDEVQNGTAEYPVCGDAFASDFAGGYNFMSVLTHARGRAVVEPLPDNVCGFNSETWNGGATPWDQPIAWPTSTANSGEMTITWDISWGPHFDDTEEFRYWITKPDFEFQAGVPLAWSDFEETEFCALTYDDSNPTANPDVVADKANALFHTNCTVPARQGRHVIYGEWGRNEYTWERFHGCIDLIFGGSSTPSVGAQITTSIVGNELTGAGVISLDGSGSQGSGLSYQWSISSHNPSLYELVNANQAVTDLNVGEPQAADIVTVTLYVAVQSGSSDTASISFMHLPASASPWLDLGQLTIEPLTLNAGDQVSLRTVTESGSDAYWPDTPVTVTQESSAAHLWPAAVATAVNQQEGDVRVGVLDEQDNVTPVEDATANRMYTSLSSGIVSGFLQIQASSGGCTCASGCSSRTTIAPDFSYDGSGQFCWEATSLGGSISSWNLTTLNINGVDLTNQWVSASDLPDAIGGRYYVYYDGDFPWSHFQAEL
jgi:chitin-binding protein